MKFWIFVLGIIVAALVGYDGAIMSVRQNAGDKTASESAYQRVLRTGTVRCGYVATYPGLMIDPETRQFSGLSYDVMQEVGRRLDLNVEWAMEANPDNAEQDMKSGYYDLLCSEVCFQAKRNKVAAFSRPIRQEPLYTIMREDEGALETGSLISVDRYNENNDDKIKAIRPAIDMCNGSFILPHGDAAFKSLIDGAIDEVIASGAMPAIYKKYLPDNPDYWRVPLSLLRGKD
jgi:ABC-type amino acid transport substrate-binding protein